jgi:hypothetical protein
MRKPVSWDDVTMVMCVVAWLLVAMLLVGGVVGCSSDTPRNKWKAPGSGLYVSVVHNHLYVWRYDVGIVHAAHCDCGG